MASPTKNPNVGQSMFPLIHPTYKVLVKEEKRALAGKRQQRKRQRFIKDLCLDIS